MCDSTEVSKQGRDDTQPERQRYLCKACDRRFDDLTGTIFAGHHQPLRVWILCHLSRCRGTIVLRDRTTRFLWDMPGGRKDRKMCKKAMRLLCQVIEQTGELTLLTDGERRSGSLLFELWSEALRTGKRGRPKKTRPKGVKVRLKNKGSQRHKRGPKRPKYQAPYPEHPDTPQPIATTEMHATHLEAFHTALRCRCATYRRPTNRYATHTGRLQERLDVYWIVQNFVLVHLTTR